MSRKLIHRSEETAAWQLGFEHGQQALTPTSSEIGDDNYRAGWIDGHNEVNQCSIEASRIAWNKAIGWT